MTRQEAVEKLAILIKDARSILNMSRSEFEALVNARREIMKIIEHAATPASMRRALRYMIRNLGLSAKSKNQAYGLVNVVCPCQWKNRKFHLRYGILRQRRCR